MTLPLSPHRQIALAILTTAIAVTIAYRVTEIVTTQQSADLFAMWLAGEFWAMGRLDQIYPVPEPLFHMTTPSEWWPYVSQTNPDARVFPFIYPPLWAKLMSLIVPHTSFAIFDQVVFGVHQVLFTASIVAAWRMAGIAGTALWIASSVTYAAMVLTTPLVLALSENQPQILVSFLIVVAFERAHFNHQRTAGALLALAASIKLFPVLFLVIFVARKQWRATISFVIVGGGLGLTSILVAGWPLHAEYLQLVSTVSRSVIVVNASISLHSLLGGLVFTDDLVRVAAPGVTDGSSGWFTIATTPLWAAASAIGVLSALGLAALAAARAPRNPFVMPALATALALLSPLSWAYTYITAFVFLLPLALRMGTAGKVSCIAMLVFLHIMTPISMLGKTEIGLTGAWIGGGILFGLMGIFFAVAAWRGEKP